MTYGVIVVGSPRLRAARDGACILTPPAPVDADGLWNGEKLARVWSLILTETNVGLAECDTRTPNLFR